MKQNIQIKINVNGEHTTMINVDLINKNLLNEVIYHLLGARINK